MVVPKVKRSSPNLFRRLFRKKATRRRAVTAAILASNALILVTVIGVVVLNRGNSSATPPVMNSVASDTNQSDTVNPLDRVSSGAIAREVATMNQLPETVAVTNQADSELADIANTISASSAAPVSEKPAVVATGSYASSKDIKQYTTVAGDTITSVAAKFGVTADSIRWSNNLSDEQIGANSKLNIPPVTGIVYTVQIGDTAATLAAKFRANEQKIIATNDAELNGLKIGDQILIPDGVKVAVATPRSAGNSGEVGLGRGFSGSASFAGNGYIAGYCTWYVKNRRPDLPSNLGNARTWATRAAAMGLPTGSTAKVGAAVVTKTTGEGHVAYVESVNDDGTITISEMNRVGWNKKSTRTIPDSGFRYIY